MLLLFSTLTSWDKSHICKRSFRRFVRCWRRSGGVPERLKGTGCKPVGVRLRWFESNPLHHCSGAVGNDRVLGRGCSSVVEREPSKLHTRVRFPSPAPIPGAASLWELVQR